MVDQVMAAITPHNTVVPRRRMQRLADDSWYAPQVNLLNPTNRGERRVKARHLRRIANARRGVEREIQEKRAFRAWRKANRLARVA